MPVPAPVPLPAPVRARPDACPGALATHSAADGELARVRVPGGALTADRLRVLAAAADDLGDGALELTSRGNVQLRGLSHAAVPELAARLSEGGLLPSAAHDRVRNVLASLLSGRLPGGHADVRPWVAAVDEALLADPSLAELPGRFLVTLDDGRGDVVGAAADVGLLATPDGESALTLAGADTGVRVPSGEAVDLLVAAVGAYRDERAAQGGGAWRLAELDGGADAVLRRLPVRPGNPAPLPTASADPPVGPLPQRDGRTALVAAVPFGRLAARTARVLAAAAAEVQVTPDRTVAVPDLDAAGAAAVAGELTRLGLVVDPGSPWRRLTACTGLPGCAKSRADVRADATAALEAGRLPGDGARQHWAGCERRCGRPRGDVLDVVATGTGYRTG